MTYFIYPSLKSLPLEEGNEEASGEGRAPHEESNSVLVNGLPSAQKILSLLCVAEKALFLLAFLTYGLGYKLYSQSSLA